MAFKKSNDINDPLPVILSEEKKAPGKFSVENKLTVAVAGALRRVGTTTQALHIAEYLYRNHKDEGKKVAYVELNNTGFLELFEKTYMDVKRDGNGNLKYDDFTLVPKDNLQSVMNGDFDYIVFDYGAYFEYADELNPEFAPLFEGQNVQILVGGSSPEELRRMTDALKDRKFRNSSIMFSFVPKGDMKAIKDLMAGWKARTHFASYDPDLFHSSELMDSEYAQLLRELSN